MAIRNDGDDHSWVCQITAKYGFTEADKSIEGSVTEAAVGTNGDLVCNEVNPRTTTRIADSNSSTSRAQRLLVDLLDARRQNPHVATPSSSARKPERSDSIPRILHLVLPKSESEDCELHSLLELAQKRLERSMDKCLAALRELRKELDLLSEIDESDPEISQAADLLRAALQFAPVVEILFGKLLRPLFDGAWPYTEPLFNGGTVLPFCRLAFLAQVLEAFLCRYTINLGQVKSRQWDGVGDQYKEVSRNIRAETVYTTLVEFLQHEITELFSLLNIQPEDSQAICNSAINGFTFSTEFERVLLASGHRDGYEILLKYCKYQNAKQPGTPAERLSDFCMVFRKVCCEVLLSMGQWCPAQSQAILNLCNEDPRGWRQLLEGHMQKWQNATHIDGYLHPYNKDIIAYGVARIFNSSELVPEGSSNQRVPPVPKEVTRILSRLNGPLLPREEALNRIIRRIIPHATSIGEYWSSQHSRGSNYSSLTFTDENTETGHDCVLEPGSSKDSANAWFKSRDLIAGISSSEQDGRGTGKTILLAMAVNCPEVRKHYADGTIWLCLAGISGQNLSYSRYRRLLEDILYQINDRNSMKGDSGYKDNCKGEPCCTHQLPLDFPDWYPVFDSSTAPCESLLKRRESLRLQEKGFMTYSYNVMSDFLCDKNILLVLDDVADPEVLQWFRFSAKSKSHEGLEQIRELPTPGVCSLLATTSNSNLLPIAQMEELAHLSIDDALTLFGSRPASSPESIRTMKGISQLLSFNPLALSCVRRLVNFYGTQAEASGEITDQQHHLNQLHDLLSVHHEENAAYLVRLILNYSLDANAQSSCLKLCFVGFVELFSVSFAPDKDSYALVSESVVDCLFQCLLRLEMSAEHCGATPPPVRDEAVSIRKTLVSLGFLNELSQTPIEKGRQKRSQSESSSGGKYYDLLLMPPEYKDYATSLREDGSYLKSVFGEESVKRWNEDFARCLLNCLTKRGSGDSCNEQDLGYMCKSWCASDVTESSILDYGLVMLPMHLARAGLYQETIDLLGNGRFVYDRIHRSAILGRTRNFTEQHIYDTSTLLNILPNAWDSATILKQLYLPVADRLMNKLRDSFGLSREPDGDEKKTVDAETDVGGQDGHGTVQEVGYSFLELGNSLMEHHCYELAIGFWKMSFDGLATHYGTRTMELLALILQNMGIIYRDALHDCDKAIECLTECLAIRRELHGDKHILTAETLRSLSECFILTGSLDDAKTGLTLSLNMLQYKPRLHREEIARIQETMGLLHYELAHYNSALLCYQEALLYKAAEFGEESEHLVSVYERIGRCQLKLGDKSSSASSILHALELLEHSCKEMDGICKAEYDATCSTLHGLQREITGSTPECLDYYRKSVSMYQELAAMDTKQSFIFKQKMASILYDIGRVHLQASENSEALRYFGMSLDTRRIGSRMNEGYRPAVVLEASETLYYMSKAFEKQGKLGKALKSLGECLKIREEYAPESEALAMTYSQIAVVADAQRDSAKAQAAQKEASEIREKLRRRDECTVG